MEKSTRYPYTYACDLIRFWAGYNAHGTKLSRSDAIKISRHIAEIIGMDDEKLANELANYFLKNEAIITEQDVKEFWRVRPRQGRGVPPHWRTLTMANVRMRCTITWTYEADPKHYGISDPKEMAAIDMNNDIELLLDIGLNEPDFNMTIEPVEGPTNGSAEDEK